jgi:hypothetical protein
MSNSNKMPATYKATSNKCGENPFLAAKKQADLKAGREVTREVQILRKKFFKALVKHFLAGKSGCPLIEVYQRPSDLVIKRLEEQGAIVDLNEASNSDPISVMRQEFTYYIDFSKCYDIERLVARAKRQCATAVEAEVQAVLATYKRRYAGQKQFDYSGTLAKATINELREQYNMTISETCRTATDPGYYTMVLPPC